MPKTKIPNLLPAILGGLVFIGALGGIYFLYNQTAQIALEQKQKEAEIQMAEAKLKELPVLTLEIKQLEMERQKLAVFIPTRENQDEFIWELGSLAKHSDIKIESCQVDNKPKYFKDNPSFQVFQWRVELSGSYPGLLRFLTALPAEKRAIKVADLSLKASKPEADEASNLRYILDIQLTLDLISLRTPVVGKDAK
jgi:Tfp pilus assembly protein PilO